MPASKMVTRSSGEKVHLELGEVDRLRGRVTISIPGYNACFTFCRSGSGTTLLNRAVITEGEAIVHVSRPVFAAMKQWAISVLNARR